MLVLGGCPTLSLHRLEGLYFDADGNGTCATNPANVGDWMGNYVTVLLMPEPDRGDENDSEGNPTVPNPAERFPRPDEELAWAMPLEHVAKFWTDRFWNEDVERFPSDAFQVRPRVAWVQENRLPGKPFRYFVADKSTFGLTSPRPPDSGEWGYTRHGYLISRGNWNTVSRPPIEHENLRMRHA
ncbi:hypothetical protein BDY21DRAFT_354305 [Lineolata rhizophorae]|uniref:Uncharacterized protein n=1 Tax=Lineolata rhizophorae TaxID=578093 RepID=A0A6A6NRP7_9PEZI|nr:hypothetical protein BDY21DRAFT_354305 [Lineolata rhizophorae]